MTTTNLISFKKNKGPTGIFRKFHDLGKLRLKKMRKKKDISEIQVFMDSDYAEVICNVTGHASLQTVNRYILFTKDKPILFVSQMRDT